MTETPNNYSDRQPSLNDRLTKIEAVLADTADLVLAHDEALARIEGAIERLTNRVDVLTEVTAINSHRNILKNNKKEPTYS